MDETPQDLILVQLRAIRKEIADLHDKTDRLQTNMDEGFLRVAKDMTGLSRLIRLQAADSEDLDKRITELETS